MNLIEGIIYMIWRGLAIGVIISAPMGPVGILCVQRTLEKGRRTGFFTGVGAALSDLFYCLVTGFGLSLIEDFLKANQNVIQIVGSIVMAVFGFYLFRSNPSRKLKKPEAAQSSTKKDVMQGFLFTFSNPLIVFLIIGLFARFNFLLPEISLIQYFTGYVFIIIGALAWWWLVSYFVDKVRSHFNLRSMWLINKITGSIIMLFAVVGIVTAVSGIAMAANNRTLYLNSSRGFSPLGSVPEGARSPLCISGDSGAVRSMLPTNGNGFTLSFRGKGGMEHDSWGIMVTGEGHEAFFSLEVNGDRHDPLYPSELKAGAVIDGVNADAGVIRTGFDAEDGWNHYALSWDSDRIVLSAGNTGVSRVLDLPPLPWRPDSVGLIVMPGRKLTVDYVKLQSAGYMPEPGPAYDFSDPDVRRSYFSRSSDAIEGEWVMFDRVFDDACLRPGGDYRLAIARSPEGYRLYYLAGARKNPSAWQPGTVKGQLMRTSLTNVFDVQWLDPAFRPLEGEIKAQFADPDLLTLNFVDHESTLRLRKVN